MLSDQQLCFSVKVKIINDGNNKSAHKMYISVQPVGGANLITRKWRAIR